MALKCMGAKDSYQGILRRRIICPECGVELTTGSITAHRCRMHRIDTAIDWSRLPVSQTENQPQVYDVIFPRSKERCPCPLPVCPGSSHTRNGFRLHFNRHHWGERIRILERHPNPLPRCERYRRQVPGVRLNTHH